MRIHIVARKIKLTQPIKEFIESKFAKLQEYIENIVWAQAIVTVEKKMHTAEVVVHVGHQTIKAAASAADLYTAIDRVMDKAEAQVKKYKERRSDHRPQEAIDLREMTTMTGPEIRFSVVKDVAVKPMRREEAVIEMEKLGFNFWMFVDKDSRQTQVVFKRLDASYGILQPVKK